MLGFGKSFKFTSTNKIDVIWAMAKDRKLRTRKKGTNSNGKNEEGKQGKRNT